MTTDTDSDHHHHHHHHHHYHTTESHGQQLARLAYLLTSVSDKRTNERTNERSAALLPPSTTTPGMARSSTRGVPYLRRGSYTGGRAVHIHHGWHRKSDCKKWPRIVHSRTSLNWLLSVVGSIRREVLDVCVYAFVVGDECCLELARLRTVTLLDTVCLLTRWPSCFVGSFCVGSPVFFVPFFFFVALRLPGGVCVCACATCGRHCIHALLLCGSGASVMRPSKSTLAGTRSGQHGA